MMRAVLAALMLALPAHAEGDVAGRFDYYVMAISWTPGWCALTGAARGAAQCDGQDDPGFTLHGLWPQFEAGYPAHCRSPERDPTRAQTAAMADIMGSGGLAWHQWKKHGRCTGLPAADYSATARRAFESVRLPESLQGLDRRLTLPAAQVKDAFLTANPRLSPDSLTVTCKSGRIQEVRICLTKDLTPRPCGADVLRDCRLRDAVMEAVP
jgi:ribonuclease T2